MSKKLCPKNGTNVWILNFVKVIRDARIQMTSQDFSVLDSQTMVKPRLLLYLNEAVFINEQQEYEG